MNLKFILISIVLSLFTTISISGCNLDSQEYIHQENQQLFYKTIDVEITNITYTWAANNLSKWSVSVKSNEYDLTGTFEEFSSTMNSSSYRYDLYCRKIKEGAIIKAKMYTWKTGDHIDKRHLNNLVK